MSKQSTLLLLLILLLTLVGCFGGGGNEQAKNDGSGSEIVGVVQTSEEPVATRSATENQNEEINAEIFLFNIDYMASGSERATVYTDKDGNFTIANAEPGRYFLEAYKETSSKIESRVRSVEVDGSGDQINLGSIPIVKPASVNITIGTSLLNNTSIEYKVYVLGTRNVGSGNEDNLSITLENIPVGEELEFKLVVSKPRSYETTVYKTVTSGISVPIDFTIPSL